MFTILKSLWKDEDGASAVEYGLIAGLIAVAIVTAAGVVGTNLNGMLARISGALGAP